MAKLQKIFIALFFSLITGLVSNYILSFFNLHPDEISFSIKTKNVNGSTFQIIYETVSKNNSQTLSPKSITNNEISFSIPYTQKINSIRTIFPLDSLSHTSSIVKFGDFTININNSNFYNNLYLSPGYVLTNKNYIKKSSSNSSYPLSICISPTTLELLHKKSKKTTLNISIAISIICFIIFILFVKHTIPFNYNTVLCGTFILILVFFFFFEKTNSTKENRKLEPFPTLSKVKLYRFTDRFTEYFNDHFPLKNKLLDLNNFIKITLLNTSPRPNDVLIGKNNYLFATFSDIVPKYSGTELYSKQELYNIKTKLTNRQNQLALRGIHYQIVIAPLKHTIYPEYLPSQIRKISSISKIDQVIDLIQTETNISISVLAPSVMSAKNNHEVDLYYKTDTHWNQLGAYYGYKKIIDDLSLHFPNISNPRSINEYSVTYKENQFSGDLLNMLSLSKYYTRTPIVVNPNFKIKAIHREIDRSASSVKLLQNTHKYSTGDTSKPNVIIFRDSFCSYLQDNLAEHFNKSSFYWIQTIEPALIEKEQPDIVVHEILERFIDNLAK